MPTKLLDCKYITSLKICKLTIIAFRTLIPTQPPPAVHLNQSPKMISTQTGLKTIITPNTIMVQTTTIQLVWL